MFAVCHMATLLQKLVGTWNPVDKDASITLANSNLSMSTSTTTVSVRSTTSHSSGLIYAETLIDTIGGMLIGVGDSGASTANYPGGTANSIALVYNAGVIKNNVLQTASGIGTPTSGDIVGIKLDLTGNTIAFNRNNGAFSATYALPTTGVAWYLMGGSGAGIATGLTLVLTPNYAIPSGYKYWGN